MSLSTSFPVALLLQHPWLNITRKTSVVYRMLRQGCMHATFAQVMDADVMVECLCHA